MRAGLQPIVQVLRRKGSPDFIEGSRLKCGCSLPFGKTVAQRQRAEASFRLCPKHPAGPGSAGTPRAPLARPPAAARRRRAPAATGGNGYTPAPAPPPECEPQCFEEFQAARRAEDAAQRQRDLDRLNGTARAQESEGLAAIVAAALQAALHPCGSHAHEQALAQMERGLKLAGRIR